MRATYCGTSYSDIAILAGENVLISASLASRYVREFAVLLMSIVWSFCVIAGVLAVSPFIARLRDLRPIVSLSCLSDLALSVKFSLCSDSFIMAIDVNFGASSVSQLIKATGPLALLRMLSKR